MTGHRFFGFASLLAITFSTSVATAMVTMPLEGRITDSDGNPILETVTLKVSVVHPTLDCTIHTEEFPDINAIDGYFSVSLGTGNSSDSLSLEQSLDNSTAATVCGPFNSDDTRRLAISFNKGDGFVQMAGHVDLGFVPYAMMARTLEGKTKNDFVMKSDDFEQDAFNDIFTNSASVGDLQSLIAGDSTKYVKATAGAGGTIISGVGSPESPNDAVNRDYADNTFAGSDLEIDTNTIGDNSVLSWDGTKWVAVPATGRTLAELNSILDGKGYASLENNSSLTLDTTESMIFKSDKDAVGDDGGLAFMVGDRKVVDISERKFFEFHPDPDPTAPSIASFQITNTGKVRIGKPAVNSASSNIQLDVRGDDLPQRKRGLVYANLDLENEDFKDFDPTALYALTRVAGSNSIQDTFGVFGGVSQVLNEGANLQVNADSSPSLNWSIGHRGDVSVTNNGKASHAHGVEAIISTDTDSEINTGVALSAQVNANGGTIDYAYGVNISNRGSFANVANWQGIRIGDTGKDSDPNFWGLYLEDGVKMRVSGAIAQGVPAAEFVVDNTNGAVGVTNYPIDFTNHQIKEFKECNTNVSLDLESNGLVVGATYKVFVLKRPPALGSAPNCKVQFTIDGSSFNLAQVSHVVDFAILGSVGSGFEITVGRSTVYINHLPMD